MISYVRNGRPFLLIPYDYEGAPHYYELDHILKHGSGVMILLEIKGDELDLDHAKYQAARLWVSAVNNWGRLGRWDFMVCKDPILLPGMLSKVK